MPKLETETNNQETTKNKMEEVENRNQKPTQNNFGEIPFGNFHCCQLVCLDGTTCCQSNLES